MNRLRRARARADRWLSRPSGFLVSGVGFLAGHLGLFLVMRLRSLAWAPGHIWDSFFQYPAWRQGTEATTRELLQAAPGVAVTSAQLWQAGALALIVLGYVGLLLGSRSSDVARRRLRPAVWMLGLASAPLLALPNLLSGDIHSYIMYGRIDLVHGGNSLLESPVRYVSDPFLQWVHWKREPSVYGPAWLYLGMGVTWLAERLGGTIITYVLLFKLVAAALHGGSAGLIWKIVGRVAPDRQAFSTLLYLLNPLLLIEFVGHGHNDVMMLFLMLVGIWLGYQQRWKTAVVMFTLAVLTKWTALVALLFYVIVAVREAPPDWRRWIRLAGIGVIVACTTVVLYGRFWEGSRTIAVLTGSPPQKLLANSVGALILELQKRQATPAAGRMMAGPDGSRTREVARAAANTGSLAAIALGAISVTTMTTAVLAAAWVMFSVCLLAVWFWPWYVTWFVCLSAIASRRATTQLAVLFSCLALAIYPLKYSTLRTPVVFLPSLLLAAYLGVRWVHAWWTRSSASPAPQGVLGTPPRRVR